MLLIVHGYQTIHREASVLYIDTGDDKQTIHLFLGNSEIDDSLYINKSAKDELRRKIESNIAGSIQYVTVQNTLMCVLSIHL